MAWAAAARGVAVKVAGLGVVKAAATVALSGRARAPLAVQMAEEAGVAVVKAVAAEASARREAGQMARGRVVVATQVADAREVAQAAVAVQAACRPAAAAAQREGAPLVVAEQAVASVEWVGRAEEALAAAAKAGEGLGKAPGEELRVGLVG